MLHCSVCRILVVAVVVVLVSAVPTASALGAKKNKNDGRTNSDGIPITENGLIDLLRADPSQVDLAKIDPRKLHLTKASVRQIDLDKWDLSKLDLDKIKDGKVVKNIIKEMEYAKRDDRTAAAYKPGELERLQQENLRWLQEPPPFREPTFTREHKFSQSEIERHAQAIDRVLSDRLREKGQEFNPLTTDEQIVRRLYISAAGRIPTAQESAAFLRDSSKSKRQQLIDKLLTSDDYPSQMFNWLGGMLRLNEFKGTQGDTHGYHQWLIDQMTSNRPWDEVVYDLLTAEGNLVTNPAVGWLTRDLENPIGGVSNTLTTFMGAAVSCAECHDHPFNKYTQRNFLRNGCIFRLN